MAITGCTEATEHKIYSGDTTTVHAEINTVDWSGDTLVIIPSIQCRSVRLGGQGVNS
jgi:hypothetical protein